MPGAYEKYLAEVLIDEETLQKRIAELGAQISQDLAGIDDLWLVCVLKGGVMFLSDLTRHLTIPHAIDFMAVTSYGAGARESSGQVRIVMDLSTNPAGKNLLIVEDIIDSGHTLDYIVKMLRTRSPKSIRICALLNKFERREVDIKIDYVGFDIANKFVYGYGLDLDERFRNMPFIGVADLNALEEQAP
ncbi:MAG: hypoxanthine phosphoribosyltransferase [Anaerolineae bacterium]|nr:hypoxanthine phosphoribosyltransferase [Anaerolineae bacterium]